MVLTASNGAWPLGTCEPVCMPRTIVADISPGATSAAGGVSGAGSPGPATTGSRSSAGPCTT